MIVASTGSRTDPTQTAYGTIRASRLGCGERTLLATQLARANRASPLKSVGSEFSATSAADDVFRGDIPPFLDRSEYLCYINK